MRVLPLIIFALASACGSTSVTRVIETVTEVPTTINGVPVTNTTITDQPGVTVNTGPTAAEIAALDKRLGISSVAYTEVNDRIFSRNLGDLPGSRFSAVPQTGLATFDGLLSVNATAPNGTRLNPQSLVTLRTDFDSGAIAATVSRPVFLTVSSELAAGNGSMALSNGTIGAGVANDVDFNLIGAVTDGTNLVEVNGPLGGKFVGTPVRGIYAAASQSTGMDITVNGFGNPRNGVSLQAFPK